MQVTGSQFTDTTALFGNDLATFPDFPAEIRAPAGTLPGVSGFQINFSSRDVYTPGDSADVLVAMNPAALKTNIADLQARAAMLIVNTENFNETDLKKAPATEQPARGPLARRLPRVQGRDHQADARGDRRTSASTPRAWTGARTSSRSGMCYWLYNRDDGRHVQVDRRQVQGASRCWPRRTSCALKAGYALRRDHRGRSSTATRSRPAKLAPGRLPQHQRQQRARASGFVAAAAESGLSCSSARTRSRRPRTCCTSSRCTRSSA